ncbi:hypothetical protein ScPMuIL_018785 [Solemya velum]
MSGKENRKDDSVESFYTARVSADESWQDWNPFPWFHTQWPHSLSEEPERKLPYLDKQEESVFTSPRTPKVPKMSFHRLPEFDPFQVFEVEQRPCAVLEIKVLCGRNITKGWSDYVDTPDPYISLRIKTAPDGRQRTATKDNEVNPTWNENFKFLLDLEKDNILQITLMEDNYVMHQTVGKVFFNINELPMSMTVTKTFLFNEISEVDLEMKMYIDKNPTLRYSLCLCDEEKIFLERRKEKTLTAMKAFLGDRGPQNLQEVPTVSVIGSGGGFRAMVGLSGVFKALADSGVLDCSTYVCGLSGSSWYISTLYSHPDWPKIKPGDMQEELKNNIDSSLMWLLKPQSLYRYIDRILQKRKEGQPVSFTDFFGHMVGETLLGGRLDSKLSDFQEKLSDGEIPLPLLTCVHVKKDRSARSFQEWVEFSPYEIGIAKYGTFMQTKLFGSKFFMGKLCRGYEEPSLHFLQGIWGSAFCILFKRLLDDNRKLDPVEMIRLEMEKQLSESQQEDSSDSSDDDSDADDDDSSSENGSWGGSSDEERTAPQSITRTEKECGKIFCYSHHSSMEKNNSKPKDKETKTETFQNMATRRRSTRRTKHKGYWHGFLKGVFENKNIELLSTRAGRAGVIHNFMRGLSLQKSFPLSPFTPLDTTSEDEFDGMWEMHPTDAKHLYMVDAGLTFNSPYPLVLRPQRSVNIILSFDFSARPSDSSPPFKELKLAEKWASLNRLPFPPIDTSVMDTQGLKELYIFKHPNDPHCPIVMHFVLVNIDFRKYKLPGVPRRSQEELDFADFDLFDDPTAPYSTFNFKYTHEAFERLSKLTEFNTLANIDSIKDCFSECVEKKRKLKPSVPVSLRDIQRLRKVSAKNKKMLSRYISRVESGKTPNSETVIEDERDSSELERPVANPFSPEPVSPRKLPLRRQMAVSLNSSLGKQRCMDDGLSPKVRSFSTVSDPALSVSGNRESKLVQRRDIPGRRQHLVSRQESQWFDARCYSIDSDDDEYHSAVLP